MKNPFDHKLSLDLDLATECQESDDPIVSKFGERWRVELENKIFDNPGNSQNLDIPIGKLVI